MNEEITQAVRQLEQSARGREALRRLYDWLGNEGMGLDQTNQAAVVTLLALAWGPCPGSVLEAIGEAVEPETAGA